MAPGDVRTQASRRAAGILVVSVALLIAVTATAVSYRFLREYGDTCGNVVTSARQGLGSNEFFGPWLVVLIVGVLGGLGLRMIGLRRVIVWGVACAVASGAATAAAGVRAIDDKRADGQACTGAEVTRIGQPPH